MKKQWQTQSGQHDGIIQIHGYFYSSLTFSELKTKTGKKIKPSWFHVSTKKKKRK